MLRLVVLVGVAIEASSSISFVSNGQWRIVFGARRDFVEKEMFQVE